MEVPLINSSYKLEKFSGKGGWTYASIPEVLQDKAKPFGWVRVKGSIDDVEFKNCHLMPMGNGRLFLPVKAEIRKKIGKKEGDWVTIILFADTEPIKIPEELLACLQDEPQAHRNFLSLPQGEQKAYIEWIEAAKRQETRIARMAETVNRATKGLKFSHKALKSEQ